MLDQEPATSPWRYAGLVPLGQALFLAGRTEEARAPLEEARTLPGARQRATSILALAYLSLIELAAGDVDVPNCSPEMRSLSPTKSATPQLPSPPMHTLRWDVP